MSINKYKEHKNIHHILTKWQVKKKEELANAIFVTLGLKEFVIFGLDIFSTIMAMKFFKSHTELSFMKIPKTKHHLYENI